MADETPGIEPGQVVGHVEPDTGQGEAADSEIPVGVDALSEEQKQAAQERGGGDEEGDGDALDVSAIMAEGDAGESGESSTEMPDEDAADEAPGDG
jgi:hypothetical protein